MTQQRSLSFSCMIKTRPAEMLRAFTHPTLLRDWLSDAASTNPRPGGHFFLRWSDGSTVTGTYVNVPVSRAPGTTAGSSVEVTWLDQALSGETRLIARVAAVEGGARLELEHCDLGTEPEWIDPSTRLESFWNTAMENLVSVLETGIDLRQARRPRLGIWWELLENPETAHKLGVPVEQGVQIFGTAENSGARAAGLEKDDVLVRLNGVALVNPGSFDEALRGLHAGDRPQIEFFRGAEKHTAPLELGSFPIPEVPETAGALAEKLRELNAGVLAAVRETVNGLPQEHAEIRPAEGEWSVQEMVAHFVLTERDYQNWVAGMINDNTDVQDWLEMRPNVTPRIRALTARIPAVADLLDEFARAQEETAAMLATVPEELVRDRKHLYRRAAQWAMEYTPAHYYEEHKEQFQKTIEHAKTK